MSSSRDNSSVSSERSRGDEQQYQGEYMGEYSSDSGGWCNIL